jgi:REP element-mobilizing transposase RayT
LFKKPEDYLAFERILLGPYRRHPIALLDWCLIPNHWHFVVFPSDDQQVSENPPVHPPQSPVWQRPLDAGNSR